jgi:uncharacterized membrane protein YpjA
MLSRHALLVLPAAVWDWLDRFRTRPALAWTLVLVNLGGVAYGFVYYGPQFGITPAWLWPWVPDSPASVGFFALAIALHQLKRPSHLVDWLAVLANVKVGLWTGFVLLYYDAHFRIFVDPLTNLNFWLFWLHLAMAVQVLVLARALRLGWWSAAAAGWFALDIAMDYGVAPFTYEGCIGTKPITVPCDSAVLPAVTMGFLVVALLAGAALARHGRAGSAPTQG